MIKINFDGIRTFEKSLEEYEKHLEEKGKDFCEELCEFGKEVAEMEFQSAKYSGINDAEVHTESTDDGCSVVAEGTSVLFIEYGTGINTAPHTEAKYPRGTYGKGRGSNEKGWVYVGDAGNNGVLINRGKVWTLGDPANECMYSASEEMRDNAIRIAKEVFSK